MRVFLTGGTGYIGAAVLDALVRAGHDVTMLVRNPGAAERAQARGVSAFVGSLAGAGSYRQRAQGFDAYVHTAFDGSDDGVAIDALTIATLGELAREAQAAFVYTSGVWVLGATREPADEDAPTNPTPLVAYRVGHEQQVARPQRHRRPRQRDPPRDRLRRRPRHRRRHDQERRERPHAGDRVGREPVAAGL